MNANTFEALKTDAMASLKHWQQVARQADRNPGTEPNLTKPNQTRVNQMNTHSRSVFASVALALAATSSFAQSPAKPSVVIVHGAFADGSDWAKVIPLLQAKGVNVIAVQNPLTSLEDDVSATKRALDTQPGKVVLVGHSWGGVVITQAGDEPKVAGLV